MESKMETTIVYWGYIGDNGKEQGNYYVAFRVLLQGHGTFGDSGHSA